MILLSDFREECNNKNFTTEKQGLLNNVNDAKNKPFDLDLTASSQVLFMMIQFCAKIQNFAIQTRKLSKKWTAKHRKELEDKLDQENRQVAEIVTNGEKSCMFGKKLSQMSQISQYGPDGIPKSPSGRLTKYFSGKTQQTRDAIIK